VRQAIYSDYILVWKAQGYIRATQRADDRIMQTCILKYQIKLWRCGINHQDIMAGSLE
jgi:hypothetical protein